MSKYYDYSSEQDKYNCSDCYEYTICPKYKKDKCNDDCTTKCIQGPRGEKGCRGERGPKGERGTRGEMGCKGERGPMGIQGPQGPQGIRGEMGPKGDQGCEGIEGAKGNPGPVGPIGPVGPVGPTGNTGPRGERGRRGEEGPQGPPGPYGVEGPPGPQGPMGVEGPEGPIGPRGCQGNNGNDGIQGPTGPKGATGAVGPSVKFISISAYASYMQGIVLARCGVPKVSNFECNTGGIDIVDNIIRIFKSGYYYISATFFIASGSPDAYFEMIECTKGKESKKFSFLPEGGGQLLLNMIVEVRNNQVTIIKVINSGDSDINLVGYVDLKGNKYASGNLLIYKYQENN